MPGRPRPQPSLRPAILTLLREQPTGLTRPQIEEALARARRHAAADGPRRRARADRGPLSAVPEKFEAKRLGALEHRHDGIAFSSSGCSVSNFSGSAYRLAHAAQGGQAEAAPRPAPVAQASAPPRPPANAAAAHAR